MDCGLKPVIHNFPGENNIFPSDYLFNITEEFCDKILSASYEPRKYRSFVEENYSLKSQLTKVNDILAQIENKIDSEHSSAVPDYDIQNLKPEKVGTNIY